MIQLTSFKRYWEEYRAGIGDFGINTKMVPAFSVAVYQPKQFPALPKLDLFDIRENGKWIRPRDFMGEGHDATQPDSFLLEQYRLKLVALYAERWAAYLHEHRKFPFDINADLTFCCWCPYDRAAQRQLKDYGSFVCHTWPIESFLTTMGIAVVRDKDREQMAR